MKQVVHDRRLKEAGLHAVIVAAVGDLGNTDVGELRFHQRRLSCLVRFKSTEALPAEARADLLCSRVALPFERVDAVRVRLFLSHSDLAVDSSTG